MKQRSSSYDNMNYDDDDDHHHNRMEEVASILLQLPNLIASRNNRLLPLSWLVWGTKRKRSAEDTSFLRRLRFPSLPQSSIPEITTVPVPVFQPEKIVVKVEASNSPATPLSFSPSESDEKQPKRLKRKLSVEKRKEELLEIKNECTITNEFLRKQVEQTRHYLMQLKAQNQSLKARKQELNGGGGVMNKEKASGILPDLNVSYPVWMDYFQPLDQGNKSYIKVMAAQARQRRMLICRNKNFGADYFQPLDQGNKSYSKVMAAQARQRRMLICRDKNFGAIAKLRFSRK